jgi:hypothetical protein
VSQRQKQRTNENRARRLGTGEGISRDGKKPSGGGGGVPAWAWVVGAAVLVAAAAIVAAIVLTQNSGSSGSGSNSSVVQDRLSTDKVDFAVEGTWPPNTDNLAAAISALGLPPAGSTTHYHSHITMYVDGQKVIVPQNIGIDEGTNTLSPIHTHDTTGVIHVESDTADFTSNLQNVFDIWGVKFDSQCIGGYCNGVKMWVNGKPNTELGNYVMKPHDAITIVEGTPPDGFKPDPSYKFPNGE